MNRVLALRRTAAIAISASIITGIALLSPTVASFIDPGTVQAQVSSSQAVKMTYTDISAGQHYTLALRDNGRLYGWGARDGGQIGDGTIEHRSEPTEVLLPEGVRVVDFAAGTQASIALTDTGQVYTWGVTAGNTPTPRLATGPWGTPAGVSAGGMFFLLWDTDGQLYSWGSNGSGRLGRGAVNVDDNNPGRVTAAGVSGIVGADGGRYGGIAWRANGTVYVWGHLLGETAGKSLAGIPGGEIRKADLGYDVAILLMSDGKVYLSTAGGAPTHQSKLPGGAIDVSTALAEDRASQTHLVATSTQQVWGWLDGTSGQLGNGSTGSNAPIQMISLATAGNPIPLLVGASDRHSIILTSDGDFIASGINNQGQLGNGTTTSDTRFRPPVIQYLWP